MTGREFTQAIAVLGMSQRRSAAFLGVDERSVRRWIAGDANVPAAVTMLLRLMVQRGISVDGALQAPALA